MGVCVFVAAGLEFRIDDFLETSRLVPATVFRKGDIPAKEQRPRPDSGFVLPVSSDESPDLSDQFQEALDFLAENKTELGRLRQLGADTLLFDFGFSPTDQPQHSNYVPPELVTAMAAFRMGIVFSVVRFVRS